MEMEELTQKIGTQVNACGDQPEVVLKRASINELSVENPLLNGNGHIQNGHVNGNGHLNGHTIQPMML